MKSAITLSATWHRQSSPTQLSKLAMIIGDKSPLLSLRIIWKQMEEAAKQTLTASFLPRPYSANKCQVRNHKVRFQASLKWVSWWSSADQFWAAARLDRGPTGGSIRRLCLPTDTQSLQQQSSRKCSFAYGSKWTVEILAAFSQLGD